MMMKWGVSIPPPAADTRYHLRQQVEHLFICHHSRQCQFVTRQSPELLNEPFQLLRVCGLSLATAITGVIKLDNHLQMENMAFGFQFTTKQLVDETSRPDEGRGRQWGGHGGWLLQGYDPIASHLSPQISSSKVLSFSMHNQSNGFLEGPFLLQEVEDKQQHVLTNTHVSNAIRFQCVNKDRTNAQNSCQNRSISSENCKK